jgi:hypothetical protein
LLHKSQIMNKQEYLIKKGRLANPVNGTLWIVKSTRTSVIMYEAQVWEIKDGFGQTTWHNLDGTETRRTTCKNYKLNDVEPYEITVYDDTNIGEKHGYCSGFGDLWSWSYLVSPDKEKALKLYEEEKIRVQTKYLIF